MALLQRFCFWFSVRLGTIIIGIASLVQASIWLMVSVISFGNQKDVTEFFNNIIRSLSITNKQIQHFAEEPEYYLISLVVFYSIFILACVFVIIGAYICNKFLLYPFLILYFVYIIKMILLHVGLMMSLKLNDDYGLASLILFSNVGALILFYLLYMWAIALSFLQIIKEIEEDIGRHNAVIKYRQKQIKSIVRMRYHDSYTSSRY